RASAFVQLVVPGDLRQPVLSGADGPADRPLAVDDSPRASSLDQPPGRLDSGDRPCRGLAGGETLHWIRVQYGHAPIGAALPSRPMAPLPALVPLCVAAPG